MEPKQTKIALETKQMLISTIFRILQGCCFAKNKVIIGPIFNNKGGVNIHIKNIVKNTRETAPFPNKLLRFLFRLPTIKTLFLKYPPERSLERASIIHTHVDPWMINLVQKRKNKEIKWIHTYHTLYMENQWNGGLTDWQKEINHAAIKIATKADTLISVSKWLQQHLKQKYNINSIYIPNGVDCNELSKIKKKPVKGFRFTDFVLYVGNKNDVKNYAFFNKLAIDNPNHNFVAIGPGLIKKDEQYPIKAANLQVFDNLEHKKVLQAMMNCKLFVMTSLSEGLPTVLMEAMFMERICLIPDNTGCLEIMQNEQNGYIYKSGSFTSLQLKFEQAVNTKNRNQIGHAAKVRIQTYYDWKKIAKKIEAQYKLLNTQTNAFYHKKNF